MGEETHSSAATTFSPQHQSLVKGAEKVLVSAPTRISPTAATEQEDNENNDQNGEHVILPRQGKLVDSFTEES
jgi:hypothetical protein